MAINFELRLRDASFRLKTCPSGFTLVEVVLAVGIIAFALTAIFGLMGLAVQGTKDSDLYVRLGAIDKRLVSSFQSQAFSAVTNHFSASNTVVTSYYDYYGNPLTDCYGVAIANNTNSKYFQCDVTNVTPATNSTNSALLQVRTSWPYVSGSSTSASSDYTVFSILNTQ